MKETAASGIFRQLATRRGFLAGMAASIGTTMAGASLLAHATMQSTQNVPTKRENAHRTALHQEISINANPHRVYDILLDSKKFAALTGAPATIDPKPGGLFSMFGGLIVGQNIELITDQLIVQAWRPTDWSPGIYSIVRFSFRPAGANTLVVMDHTGFPEGEFDHLEWGWNSHYWEPLKKFVAS